MELQNEHTQLWASKRYEIYTRALMTQPVLFYFLRRGQVTPSSWGDLKSELSLSYKARDLFFKERDKINPRNIILALTQTQDTKVAPGTSRSLLLGLLQLPKQQQEFSPFHSHPTPCFSVVGTTARLSLPVAQGPFVASSPPMPS